ncbi:MAG TPA: ArgE/DapE family deacylase, partial [Candidatus Atribacteria bacterium]|nr:ArgE/DapE family deacylase [Candidatus Atribacteria bacterium]
MNIYEKKIIKEVENHKNSLIEFTRDLIKIPSENPPGNEKECQIFLAKKLKELGFDIDLFSPDDVKELFLHPFYKHPKTYIDRPNLVGSLHGEKETQYNSLILNGHVDVTKIENPDRWTHDPFGGEIDKGRIWGRGASDMKSGLASMIFAIHSILYAGFELEGNLYIESVVDEEGGGNGTLSTLLKGYTADAAIVTEPTNLNIMTSCRGGGTFRITVTGLSAHPSVKWRGVDPIEKMVKIYKSLEKCEKQRHEKGKKNILYRDLEISTPINIGYFSGGPSFKVTPSEATVGGWFEWLPDEEVSNVCNEISKSVEEVTKDDSWLKNNPPKIEFFREFGTYSPAYEINPRSPIVKELKHSYTEIFSKKPMVGGTGPCDARYFPLVSGIPAVIFGPGELYSCHGVDEFVDIENLVNATKILA